MNKKLFLLPAALMLLTSCGGGSDTPKPAAHDGSSEELAFTAAEAKAACEAMGLSSGTTTPDKYYIKDVVKEVKSAYDPGYGNLSLTLGANGDFLAYRVGKLVNGAFAKIGETDPEAELQAGDTVCIYGTMTNYNGTYETPQNVAGIVSYTFGPHHVTPEPPQTHEVNVAGALQVINGLADGAKTTDKYKVTGIVKGEVKVGKSGDYQFHMVDALTDTVDLYVYYATPAEGVAQPKEGDTVVVEGLLQKYVDKSGNVVPEMPSGTQLLSVTSAN